MREILEELLNGNARYDIIEFVGIDQALLAIRQKLIKAMPKKKIIAGGVEEAGEHYRIYGFNQCLSQVHATIDKLFGGEQ